MPLARPSDWVSVLKRGASVSDAIREGAMRTLESRSDRVGEIPSSAMALKSWIHKAQIEVSKVTRRQHLEGIALAYALYAHMRNLPGAHDLLRLWANQIDKKPTKRTDALHIIVASIVSYGGNTPEDRARARRLYSRDVQAIRYLISEGISPIDIEEKAAEEGEGLDAWARRYTASQEMKASGANPKGQQSYIEWKKKTREGKIVVVKRISLDHLTTAQQENLLQGMEEYSQQKKLAGGSGD